MSEGGSRFYLLTNIVPIGDDMKQIQNDISEKELYQLMASKYGEDIAILAKLRLNEIYRLLQEELDIAGQESQEIVMGNELHLLFMQKFFTLLERDQTFSNMVAADKKVRSWVVAFWSSKHQ